MLVHVPFALTHLAEAKICHLQIKTKDKSVTRQVTRFTSKQQTLP